VLTSLFSEHKKRKIFKSFALDDILLKYFYGASIFFLFIYLKKGTVEGIMPWRVYDFSPAALGLEQGFVYLGAHKGSGGEGTSGRNQLPNCWLPLFSF
jgi:hypothetical protein